MVDFHSLIHLWHVCTSLSLGCKSILNIIFSDPNNFTWEWMEVIVSQAYGLNQRHQLPLNVKRSSCRSVETTPRNHLCLHSCLIRRKLFTVGVTIHSTDKKRFSSPSLMIATPADVLSSWYEQFHTTADVDFVRKLWCHRLHSMYAVRLSRKMGEIIMMMMRATGRGDEVDSIIACSQREVDKNVRHKQEWLIEI